MLSRVGVLIVVGAVVVATLVLTAQSATAGEPEFACSQGTLVGTNCEIEGSPPVLNAPCPDPSPGADSVFYDDGACYESTFVDGAPCTPPAISSAGGAICLLEVTPLGQPELTCQAGFDLIDTRCLRVSPAACTSLYVEVWIDDDGDGIRQLGETTDPNATINFYEATADGSAGAQVQPVRQWCVMSGSYVVEVVSDRLTVQNTNGGVDDSQFDPVTRLSEVVELRSLDAALVRAGIVPEVVPVPLVPGFGSLLFSCDTGFNVTLAGGDPDYLVSFRVEHPPTGGLPRSDIFLAVVVTEPGAYSSGPPYLRNYDAGVTYSVTFMLSDSTGRSATASSTFTLTENCAPGAEPQPLAGYVPLTPRRIVDSRPGPQQNVGPFNTAWGPSTSRSIDATTALSGVPSEATAVAVNVTTVNATAPFSWLTIYPAGDFRPATAALNFGTSPLTSPIKNDLVITKVDHEGHFVIYNEAGSADIVVDLVGYYTTADQSASYVAIVPERIVDSRADATLNVGSFNTPWPASGTRTVNAGSAPSVPEGISAVVANVTTVNNSAPFSWLTVFPTGTDRPTAASLNFGNSELTTTITNDLVIAGVDENGNFDVYNEAGTTDIVIDVVGYFTTSDAAEATRYRPIRPFRLVDSRPQFGSGPWSSPWQQAQSRSIDVTSILSPVPANASAVAVHLTTVNAADTFSWLTAHPTGSERPTTASLNFGTAATTSPITNDLVITKIDSNGRFEIFNALGTTDMVVDVVGYFE